MLAPPLAQFAAVARLEHVTRAAAQLGMPQPTLSRAVARVEEDLGVVLLAREGRTVRLTRAGRIFLAAVERALSEVERGAEAARAEADPTGGRVAFGFLHTMGSEAVPMLLRGFRGDHPRVRFQLVQDYTDSMLERLRAGELDLCLVSPRPEGPELTSRRLGEQRLRLVVPADHRLAGRQRVRLSEAADDPFVTLEPGYGLRRITDALCAEAGFSPRISFEGEESETLRGLVAAGLGVAVLPPSTVARPDVAELWLSSPGARREIALAWVTGRTLTPPAEAFRAYVLSVRGQLPLHS
ncbi:LysR family transcriptional regulator [Streptacidiphilus cavernicola]|uniref:LysR family transcriptional regulator n=1 Tax=Streptacidiphilus cavernicola TaxID=3342716 RepID=A0ABV6VTD0_9ACTN